MTTKQTDERVVNYEHISIIHEWIRVDVVVDYQNMKVSIVDSFRNKKNYMFCERWLSYRDNWYNILKAIEKGMDVWFSKLEERQDKDTGRTLKLGLEMWI